MDFEAYLSAQDAVLHISNIKYTNELEYMDNFFQDDPEVGIKVYSQAVYWLNARNHNDLFEKNYSKDSKNINNTDANNSWKNILEDQLQESKNLREEGNRVFQSNEINLKENKLVKAIRLYTEAIFAACKGFCICLRLIETQEISQHEYIASIKLIFYEDLSLAYANRSIVLYKFGYLQEAYDDCCCALEIGYPKRAKRYQILWRQINCSSELKQFELMRKHLTELKQFMNECHVPGKDRLQLNNDLKKFELILKEEQENKEKEAGEVHTVINSMNRESQQICISKKNEYGRHLVTRHQIKANELIFRERATAINPVDLDKVCSECARTNIIPIPCQDCGGTIVYCSLACLRQHRDPVHRFECPGYRLQFLQKVGVALISLRMLLDNGLIQLLETEKENLHAFVNTGEKNKNNQKNTNSKNKNNNNNNNNTTFATTELYWRFFKRISNECYANDSNDIKSYRESLQLIDHLENMSLNSRNYCGLLSHLIVIYLMVYTDYFRILQDIIYEKNDPGENSDCIIKWPTIIATLIFRHMAQIQVNGYVCNSLKAVSMSNKKCENLLNETIWLKSWHLKCGFLHSYADISDVAVFNLPYASLCNHACKKVFYMKCSERWVNIFAREDMSSGSEITHCYRCDYNHQRRKQRREELRELYHFDCKCSTCEEPCSEEDEDRQFYKYHQYLCENQFCKKIYVHKVKDMRWWESPSTPNLFCTHCGLHQKFNWWKTCSEFINQIPKAVDYGKFMKMYQQLDTILVDYNDFKAYIASIIIENIFYIFTEDQYTNSHKTIFKEINCNDLLNIIRFHVNYKLEKNGLYTLSYVTAITYFWDLIAINNDVDFDVTEIQKTLQGLEILQDDVRIIFVNYYHEYIRDKIREKELANKLKECIL